MLLFEGEKYFSSLKRSILREKMNLIRVILLLRTSSVH